MEKTPLVGFGLMGAGDCWAAIQCQGGSCRQGSGTCDKWLGDKVIIPQSTEQIFLEQKASLSSKELFTQFNLKKFQIDFAKQILFFSLSLQLLWIAAVLGHQPQQAYPQRLFQS